MIDLNYRYCKHHMAAYVAGDLRPAVRRRVARLIDSDPRCYRLYMQQREVMRALDARLPGYGTPDAAQLDRVWAGIQASLTPSAARPRRKALHVSPRYGVVTALVGVLLLAMIVPLAVWNAPVAAITPATPPEPVTPLVAATELPQPRVQYVHVGYRTGAHAETEAHHQTPGTTADPAASPPGTPSARPTLDR